MDSLAARCAFAAGSAALIALAACGGGGGSGSGGTTFNCMSSCPMDPVEFSMSTSCQGSAPGPCAVEFAAFMQCEHDNRVCDSSGYTDYSKTDAFCVSQKTAWESCLSCGSDTCPDASAPADGGGG